MKAMACALLGALGIVTLAIAGNPLPFGPSTGGPPIEGGRDVCWNQPGDNTYGPWSSEVIDEVGPVSEIANDFMFETNVTITMARWWGAYFLPEVHGAAMNLRIYADAGCAPADLIAEWLSVDGNETDLGYASCVYTYPLGFSALGSTLYWFSAQAANHSIEWQWGRLSASTRIRCHSVLRSEYFSYPDWTVVFYPFRDASQEFECDAGTATARTTWGVVKELYR